MNLIQAIVVPPFCERDSVVCLKRVGHKDVYASCYCNEGSKHFVVAFFWGKEDAQDYIFHLDSGPDPLYVKAIIDYWSVVMLTSFLHQCVRQNASGSEILTIVPESSVIFDCYFEFCSSQMQKMAVSGF